MGRGAGGARADPPEDGRRRGPLTLRERGSRDCCPGRRMSFGFLPREAQPRVPDFALCPNPRSDRAVIALLGPPVPDSGMNGVCLPNFASQP